MELGASVQRELFELVQKAIGVIKDNMTNKEAIEVIKIYEKSRKYVELKLKKYGTLRFWVLCPTPQKSTTSCSFSVCSCILRSAVCRGSMLRRFVR